MSSMEDSEVWSDRALSSCSCSWLAIAALFCRIGKVSVSPVLRRSLLLFLVDRPGRALTCDRLDVHFCLLLAVLPHGFAELPNKARFRRF